MRTYDSYKNSGIEWIGEIPRHWLCVKPQFLFRPSNRNPHENDEIVTCFRDGVVTLRKNRREDGFTTSLKEIGYQRILVGDLVIHEMDGFEGSIGVSDSIGKSTPVYTVISESESHSNRYWMYLLREMSNTKFIQSLSKSIRERTTEFRWNMWKNQLFPLPPLSEQEQIVSYLDEKTSLIDEMVEKKKRKIGLLKEYRTSLINTVVTKGLNPDVPMKDSGIEWIGEIPRHWEVKRFKDCHYEVDEIVGSDWSKYSLLSLTKNGVVKRDIESGIGKFPESFETYKKVGFNDLIFCLYDIEETPRTVGLSKLNGMITGSYKIIKSTNVIPEYTYYVYLTIDDSKGLKPYYTGLRNTVRTDTFNSIKYILPPLSEQEQIVSYLDEKTSEIDKTIELENKKIELLKEYRQSLISNVVTGKIKVVSE